MKTMLRDDFRAFWGIKYYAKVKDDCLIIADVQPGKTRFLREAFCSFPNFEIDKWESSLQEVDMLDISIFKGSDFSWTRRLSYKPHFKKTSLGVPLSVSSCHPRHVHSSWTKAFVDRNSKRSCSREWYLEAKETFLRRLQNFYYPQALVRQLRDFGTLILSAFVHSAKFTHLRQSPKVVRSEFCELFCLFIQFGLNFALRS